MKRYMQLHICICIYVNICYIHISIQFLHITCFQWSLYIAHRVLIFTTCIYIFWPQLLKQPGWHWIYFCLFESQYTEKHTNRSFSREIWIINSLFIITSSYYFFPQDFSCLWSSGNELQLFFRVNEASLCWSSASVIPEIWRWVVSKKKKG